MNIALSRTGNARGRASVWHAADELVADERSFETITELVHKAGKPFVDWFFGDAQAADAITARWIRRASSELAAGRMRVLVRGDRVVGLFLAASGADLAAARAADTFTALKEAGAGRSELRERIATADRLFLPVEPEWFYLSRLAVVPEARGRGLGRMLVEEYLAAGTAAGYNRFCLDVSAENEIAVRLYGSFGFEVHGERDAAGMRYLRMGLVAAQHNR